MAQSAIVSGAAQARSVAPKKSTLPEWKSGTPQPIGAWTRFVALKMHNNWTYRIYPYEPAMNAVWHNKMPNTPNGSDGWYGIDDIGLPMDRVFLECQKDRRLDPSDYLYLQRESLDGLKAVRAHAKHLKLVEVEGF